MRLLIQTIGGVCYRGQPDWRVYNMTNNVVGTRQQRNPVPLDTRSIFRS